MSFFFQGSRNALFGAPLGARDTCCARDICCARDFCFARDISCLQFLSHPFLTSPEPNTPCDAQNNQKWYYTHQPKVDDVLFPVVLQVCIQNNITVPRVEHTMWFWWYLFKLKAFNSPNLYCACSIIRKSAGHGCPPVMHGSHFKLWSLVKLFWKRESGKKTCISKTPAMNY